MDKLRNPEAFGHFQWYHTIDFGDGLVTDGTVDCAPFLPQYGFPDLAGKRVLDIGASDGFFTRYFETNGSREVVPIDIDRWRKNIPDFDYSPRLKNKALEKYRPNPSEETRWEESWRVTKALGFDHPNPFFLTKRFLGLKAELEYVSLYEMNEQFEPFDVVFCGTMNPHIKNLLGAFEAMRHATRELCIISAVELLMPEEPSVFRHKLGSAFRLAIRHLGLKDQFLFADQEPACLYTGNSKVRTFWRPSVKAFREMLLASDFRSVEIYSRFTLTNKRHGTPMKHVVFHCYP